MRTQSKFKTRAAATAHLEKRGWLPWGEYTFRHNDPAFKGHRIQLHRKGNTWEYYRYETSTV